MKNKKLLVLLIYIILNFSFLFQNYNLVNKVREESDKDDIESNLSFSNSVAYDWSVTWDGGFNDGDYAYAITLDSLGNIYLVGDTYNPTSMSDICLLKFNSEGNYQWNRTWDGLINENDGAHDIVLDSSENIYLAGYTNKTVSGYDICLLKFDSSGNYQWNRTLDGGYDEWAAAIALDSSSNIYLAGSTSSIMSNYDFCLVKFDSSGNYQWNSTWDGGVEDYAYDIALDSSGNIYLAGVTYNATSYYDMCLVKFDSSGAYQWARTWDRNINDEDWAYAIALDSSNNIYLAGWSYNMAGDSDMCLLKFNNYGDFQWNRTWDGVINDNDFAYDITLDSSENIYLAGSTYNMGSGNDFCVVKFDSSGNYQWNNAWHGGIDDFAFEIALDSSENIYLAGYTYNTTSWDDMCLVKYNSAPKIRINTPIQNKFYGIIPPGFDISILESELDTSWYSLDGGTTNITFSGSVGIISQAEWDKKGDGLVTIEFFANDSMSLGGSSEVSVYKDITAPTSSISFIPHSGTNTVNKSTTFTLTADDGQGSGVASIIYKINDGDWINYSTPFDLSDFKSGNYNISFYSIDKVGNIENINSVLVKIPGPAVIPGYNIYLLISLICVVSVISFKLRNKILK